MGAGSDATSFYCIWPQSGTMPGCGFVVLGPFVCGTWCSRSAELSIWGEDRNEVLAVQELEGQTADALAGSIGSLARRLGSTPKERGQVAGIGRHREATPKSLPVSVGPALTAAYEALSRLNDNPFQQWTMERAIEEAIGVGAAEALVQVDSDPDRVMHTLLRHVFRMDDEATRDLMVRILVLLSQQQT